MVQRRMNFHKEEGHTKSSKQANAVLEIATDGWSISYVFSIFVFPTAEYGSDVLPGCSLLHYVVGG